MYRSYENPMTLQERLDSVLAEYHKLKALGQLDICEQADYEMEIADLRDRINYAWSDDSEE